MFDLGLGELGLIAVVALVVIGPKRLPAVARTVGTLIGRAQRYVSDVKAEVNEQIAFDEIKKAAQSLQDGVRQAQQSVTSELDAVNSQLNDLTDSSSMMAGVSVDELSLLHKRDYRARAERFHRRVRQQQSRIPNWYKQQHMVRRSALSGAARMVRFRVNPVRRSSFFE